MKFCYLDFEFNNTAERKLNLVSVALKCIDNNQVIHERCFWLHKATHRRWCEAMEFLWRVIQQGYVLVSFAFEAEARSLMTMFQDDDRWFDFAQVIDLYLEYRCALNRNDALSYGKQLIDGKIKTTTPPPNKYGVSALGKYDKHDAEEEAHHKPSYSLAAACFKMLGGLVIDTEQKTKMRDIIIRGDAGEIEANRLEIEAYNKSDIEYLPKLHHVFIDLYLKKGIPESDWYKWAFDRGDYALRTARMVRLGYPIDIDKLKAFTANTAEILKSAAEQCNETSPDVQGFRWGKKEDRYIVTEKNIRRWIETQAKPYWRQTKGKALSLSKEAFGDWYDSQSEGFGGAFCKYLKTKQSLNGFLPGGSKKGTFFDYLGEDGRVRPYFGIYGSQTSRSQPAATGFIPLKAHWMRNFIAAPPGRALAGIDYASQEFLVAAILSQDDLMIEAYESGDVYMAFAIAAGLAPPDATKATHGVVRELCKALVLGISYDMSPRGLAPRLSGISKEVVTEDYAASLIDLFYETYSDYKSWKDRVQVEYQRGHYLQLPDGWTMWGDNDNAKSVGNFPVQGHGAHIMREAVRRAQDRGLEISFTLHDALYIEYDAYKVEAIETLMSAMQDAFLAVMAANGRTLPIRLEGESWAPAYGDKLPRAIPGVTYLAEYEDAKGKVDLERYRPFLTPKFSSEKCSDVVIQTS